MTRPAETLREQIARATWEQWRTLDIAAESCRDLPYDELLELAKAPPLERTGHNPAAQILEAALIQADAALAAIEAAGFVVVPVEPTAAMLHEAAKALSPGRRPTPAYVTVKEKHAIRYRAMVLAARPRDAAPTEAR